MYLTQVTTELRLKHYPEMQNSCRTAASRLLLGIDGDFILADDTFYGVEKREGPALGGPKTPDLAQNRVSSFEP